MHNMAVPDFQSLMLPLLKLAVDGQQDTLGEAVERLAQEFELSDDDRKVARSQTRSPTSARLGATAFSARVSHARIYWNCCKAVHLSQWRESETSRPARDLALRMSLPAS